MDQPRISIGLPIYNAEKYLRQALDSILAQTYTDFKLIISDNASTDSTEQICREYADRDARIAYYRNEKNLGASPNYNRVFHLSTSEYFKWAAYDDLIEPEFLAKCVEVMDQHPDAVLAFPRVKIIDQNGDLVENYIPEPDTARVEVHKRFRNLLLYPHLSTQFYGLLRTDLLRKTSLHGNFPSSDEVLLIELGFQGEFYEIPENLFLLRKHPEQSTEGIYKVQRARSVWFDTSLKGKVLLPKWIYFFACLHAVQHAKISLAQRMFCYRQLVRWVFIPAHFRAMGKDGLLAAGQLIRRLAKSDAQS